MNLRIHWKLANSLGSNELIKSLEELHTLKYFEPKELPPFIFRHQTVLLDEQYEIQCSNGCVLLVTNFEKSKTTE